MKTAFAKIIFGLTWLLAISSCEKDSCNHVSCPGALECSHGSCVCPDGYQGTNCDTLSYPKYLGEYEVTEAGCTNFISPYLVNLYWGGTADSLPQVLYVNPMFSQGPLQMFIVNIPGSLGVNLNVPQQTVGVGYAAVSLYGTGTITINNTTNLASRIDLNLTYTYDGGNYTCTEILSRYH